MTNHEDDLFARGQSSIPIDSWEILTSTSLLDIFLHDMRLLDAHKKQ